jgi:hypothetical protein
MNKKERRTMSLAAIVIAIAVVGVAGFTLMKSRFGMGAKASFIGQITIFNDSTDKVSIEYKVDSKEVAAVISPNEKVTCGEKGFVRLFTSDKAGAYEIMYPADALEREVRVSQIVGAAQKKDLGDRIASAKGMVGDIKVNYEEVRQLPVTY